MKKVLEECVLESFGNDLAGFIVDPNDPKPVKKAQEKDFKEFRFYCSLEEFWGKLWRKYEEQENLSLSKSQPLMEMKELVNKMHQEIIESLKSFEMSFFSQIAERDVFEFINGFADGIISEKNEICRNVLVICSNIQKKVETKFNVREVQEQLERFSKEIKELFGQKQLEVTKGLATPRMTGLEETKKLSGYYKGRVCNRGRGLAMHPNKHLYYTLTDQGVLTCTDERNDKVVWVKNFSFSKEGNPHLSSVALAPSGKYVLVLSVLDSLMTFLSDSGEVLSEQTVKASDQITRVCFVSETDLLLGLRNGEICLMEEFGPSSVPRPTMLFKVDNDDIHCFAYSQKQNVAIVGSVNGTVFGLNCGNFSPLWKNTFITDGLFDVKISKDGEKAVLGMNPLIMIDVKTGKTLWTTPLASSLWELSFAYNEQFIFTFLSDYPENESNEITIFSANSGKVIHQENVSDRYFLKCMFQWSFDPSIVVTSTRPTGDLLHFRICS